MPGKDRQRQLAREKVERQMAKRAAAVRRRRQRQAILGSVVAVLAVLALGGLVALKLNGDDKASRKPAAKPSASPAASSAASPSPGTAPCLYTRPPTGQGGPTPRKVSLPPITGVVKTGTARVLLTTNQGALTLSLDRAKTPCTVNSFVSLAKQKFFDKTSCHRLTTSGIFVLQCGDPAGSGQGGPGYAFADEGLPANRDTSVTYPAGTVAMANSGADTNGSQFFIVYKDTQFPPNYTIFGRVTAGLDVVQKVAAAGSDPAGDGKPKQPVTIETATVAG